MARGRFVSKAISLDEKVNSLSNDTARLLFTWLIPHLDCEGRMHGDAITVKSIVFPRKHISSTKIEKILKELEKHQLILRYSVQENTYLLMKTFEKHQPGLNKLREAQSQIPSPTPDLFQSNSGLTPQVDKEQVKVKAQVKDNTTSKEVLRTKNSDPRISEIFGEMHKFLNYEEGKNGQDPIPNYGKEGKAIKRILQRGFSAEQILTCWKGKVSQRQGNFVSMVYVNEDIGKKTTGRQQTQRRQCSTDEEIRQSIEEATTWHGDK